MSGLKVCVCVCVRPGLLCEGVNSRVIHTRDSAPSSLTQRHWGINSVLSDPSGDMPILGVSIQHAEKQHTQSRCPQDTGAQSHDCYNLDFGHLRTHLHVTCTYSLIKVQKDSKEMLIRCVNVWEHVTAICALDNDFLYLQGWRHLCCLSDLVKVSRSLSGTRAVAKITHYLQTLSPNNIQNRQLKMKNLWKIWLLNLIVYNKYCMSGFIFHSFYVKFASLANLLLNTI